MSGKIRELVKRVDFVSNRLRGERSRAETAFLKAKWILAHLTPEEIETLAGIVRNTRLPHPLTNLDLCPVLVSISPTLMEMVQGELKERKAPSEIEAATAGRLLLTAYHRSQTAFYSQDLFQRKDKVPCSLSEEYVEELRRLFDWFRRLDAVMQS